MVRGWVVLAPREGYLFPNIWLDQLASFSYHIEDNITSYCTYVAVWVSNSLVELFAIEHQELLTGGDYSTLDSNGPGSVDVVPSHHSDCDASLLTLRDSRWHLIVTRKDIGKLVSRASYKRHLSFRYLWDSLVLQFQGRTCTVQRIPKYSLGTTKPLPVTTRANPQGKTIKTIDVDDNIKYACINRSAKF